MARFRDVIGMLAEKRGEWAGVPMPLSGHRLVIDPSYPFAEDLGQLFGENIWKPTEDEHLKYFDADSVKVRNTFWSTRYRTDVAVCEKDGRVFAALVPHTSPLAMLLRTADVADAWGIEQEHNALMTLGTMVPHFAFKRYLLTGMLMERSKRSGLSYLFRKLRPTLVIDARDTTSNKSARVLCALCMHPVAYYAGTWGGAMCPTDDVIAALSLMRGDEHLLWRRCNQHPPYRTEAGLYG